jgi:hypothetical protein
MGDYDNTETGLPREGNDRSAIRNFPDLLLCSPQDLPMDPKASLSQVTPHTHYFKINRNVIFPYTSSEPG